MKKLILLAVLVGLCSFLPNAEGINIGDTAPNIELKNPKGKSMKLSDLKGKIVLIDFWASWCGPCRRENPNVVQAYNKYKDIKFKNAKGFEVFSVSLDRSQEPWVQAITKDGLVWNNHVWDKEGTVSNTYKVQYIPSTFLIDGEGKVIAKGDEIRGMDLHTTLDGLIK